jgi:hypothetical protein
MKGSVKRRMGVAMFLKRYLLRECFVWEGRDRYSCVTAILSRPCSGPGGDEENRFQARLRV